jgi:hypothetical protein
VPLDVRFELVGDFAGPGADDEPEPVVFQGQQVRRGQHSGVGHDHDVVCLVAVAEPGQDRDQRLGLGLVALEPIHTARGLGAAGSGTGPASPRWHAAVTAGLPARGRGSLTRAPCRARPGPLLPAMGNGCTLPDLLDAAPGHAGQQ